MSKVKLLLDVVEDLRSLADSVQAVADAMLQNEPTVDAEAKTPAPAPKKKLTLEEVRAVLGEKSRAGFTAEIQALLKKYGAPKLSGIDPKHYEALLKDVEVLNRMMTSCSNFSAEITISVFPRISRFEIQIALGRSSFRSADFLLSAAFSSPCSPRNRSLSGAIVHLAYIIRAIVQVVSSFS